MKWRAEDLQNKIHDLEQRIQRVSSLPERTLLKQDLNNLKYMHSFLECAAQEGPKIEHKPMQVLNNDEYFDTAEVLDEIGPKIARKFMPISHLHNVRSRIVFQKSIGETAMMELISSFLASYDNDLLELFNKYQLENRILLSSKSFETRSCAGKCFPLINEGSSYICAIFNQKLTNGITLVHELGHADEFEGVNDIYQIQRLVYNVFGEAYAIYLEYAFIEFLKNTPYRKMAFDEQAHRMNNFLAFAEYYLISLYNLKSVDPLIKQINYNGYFSKKKQIDTLLSNMLAMYWQSIYINNPEEAKKQTSEYKEKSREKTLRDIITDYSIDDLHNGVNDVFHNYYENYRKK